MLQVTLAYESIVLYMCEGKVLMDNYIIQLTRIALYTYLSLNISLNARLKKRLPEGVKFLRFTQQLLV